MPKLKLNLDLLAVDSFPVAEAFEVTLPTTTVKTVNTDTGNCGCPTVSTDWC